MKERVRLVVRCDEELKERLKELAKESRRSLSEYVVYILEKSIKEESKGLDQ